MSPQQQHQEQLRHDPAASPPPTAICCGLSTLDMQLHACDTPLHLEHITKFSHTTTTAGGSAPQTALALSALRVRTAVLTAVGDDAHAAPLLAQLAAAGVDTSAVAVDPAAPTALAVLPLYRDGRRGCLVTLGANLAASPAALLPRAVAAGMLADRLRVFHFGYPHLMPLLRGAPLRALLDRVRELAPRALLSLDLNGADVADDAAAAAADAAGETDDVLDGPVVTPALPVVALVHANIEEAATVTGLAAPPDAALLPGARLRRLAEWFVERGAGMATITAGRDGAFAATASREQLDRVRLAKGLEEGVCVHRAAFTVAPDVAVNASGAGDAFVAGALAELAETAGDRGVARLLDSGMASALRRIDHTLVMESVDISKTVAYASERERIVPRREMTDGFDTPPVGRKNAT